MDITPVFVSSQMVHGLNIPDNEIRYFGDCQMKALLDAPGREKRSERRNRMLLIPGYDAAMRVGELTGLKMRRYLIYGYWEKAESTGVYQ